MRLVTRTKDLIVIADPKQRRVVEIDRIERKAKYTFHLLDFYESGDARCESLE